MKVGITVDDVRRASYVLGKYDFYTREVELPDDVVRNLQAIQHLSEAAGRVLASAYASHGKFVLPEDLEVISCLTVKTAVEPKTRAAKSAKKQEQQDSAAPSNSESQSS